jgi:DNA mismatch repair protein MutS2
VSARQGRTIHVDQFIHPLLQLKAAAAVPIDLWLGNESSSQAALIISGANGGGKTLSMKSFGLVCVMAKLAIPIVSSSIPVVDFFDEILVSVGDYQDIEDGESTFTAR